MTVEEVNALPVGSLVAHRDGHIHFRKREDGQFEAVESNDSPLFDLFRQIHDDGGWYILPSDFNLATLYVVSAPEEVAA